MAKKMIVVLVVFVVLGVLFLQLNDTTQIHELEIEQNKEKRK